MGTPLRGTTTPIDENLISEVTEDGKRKASESPEISPGKENTNKKLKGVKKEIKIALETVIEAIKDLCFEVMDYSKSKNSMKEQAEKLKELNRTLLEGFVMKSLMESQLDSSEEVKETAIVNKSFCSRCSVALEREQEETKSIIQKIKDFSTLSHEDFNTLMNSKWPQIAYVKTKVVIGNPMSTKCENLIVCYEENEEDSTLMKIVREKFPEIEEVIEGETDVGKVPFLESIVNTSKGTHKKRIYFVKMEENTRMEEKFTICRSEIEKYDGKKIAVAVAAGKKREKVRKSLELTFYNDEGEDPIEFYMPQGERDSKKERQREEAIIIDTNISTYADTLRNIRAVVNPEELGIEVKTVKTTRDKKVVIITKEGQADALHKEISTKITGIETRISGRNSNTLFIILDIDASINGKEVEDFIRKSTKVFATEVKHLRTTKSGTQIATVSMPSYAAENLIREGVIKIGWTLCRVKPKIDILRCYNCLNLGHHSDICPQERRGKKCLNCTQTDHLIKDCRNPSFCTTCNKQGHKGDSTNCPTYRRRIQEATSKYYQNIENTRESEKDENTNNGEEEEEHKEGEDVNMREPETFHT